ncbi:MAG: ribonuclease HII [Fimbriimonadaceae bacterium]|nr:ribonuclease HII [Fimbriimonadaceae bacterium]
MRPARVRGLKAHAPKGLLAATPGWAGVDEAGRGPLAGPVYAAAVILPQGFDCTGIDDSKVLDRTQREDLALRIRSEAMWSIAAAEPDEVDRLNILHATMAAMLRAVQGLASLPNGVYVDGNRLPPGLPVPGEAVVDGDATHACIAAASILAKTARDDRMRELALDYPGYGFERHFGYSTPEHFAALEELGPCPIHRRSFAPVRASEQLCLTFDE